ncbi:hypothetical protein EMIT0158MI4_120127 [Burkholderia ambifaria]
MAFRSISAPSTYSFFFFFNELERREKGTAATGAKIGLVAKTHRLVAIRMRFMAALFSTIKDLRADSPENHDSRALPARSLWKNRLARPLSLKARVVARPFRLAGGTGGSGQHGGRMTTCADCCAHRRTHPKLEYRAATRPERRRKGVRPRCGRIG